MILRFLLSALLVAGVLLPASDEASSEAPAGRVDATASPAGATAEPTAPPAPGDDEFREVPVVVPAVTADGTVVEPPAAEAERDAVVADEVVQGRVVTPVLDAVDYQTVGVTWAEGEAGEAPDVEVRSRTDGAWGDWVALETDDTAPDAGTADAEQERRAGTEPLWFGDAESVQLSFAARSGSTPDAIALVLVGSDDDAGQVTGDEVAQSTADEGATIVGAAFRSESAPATASSSAAVLAAAPPSVITRAQWGAVPQVCAPDVASSLVGAVVHHTAGSNGYGSVGEAMQQIRNDQRYHIEGRGWCDLGYNFVVDKWGNLYEGRGGSLTLPVIGVHAGGFNTGTVGVAMLGTYDAVPPAATQDSVAAIIGWRLAAYNVDPTGTMRYTTGAGENSRYTNTTVTLPRVFGHRDVAYTACPGNGGHAALPLIRTIARNYYDARQYAEARSVVTALYVDLLGRGPDPTGLQGWSAALLSGTSQSALVASLTRSDEYISLRVAKAYREVLGRDPDPVGAAAWLSQIRAGLGSVDDVQRRFYDSDEYFAASGGTWQGYVKRLYSTMLRRGAADAEVASWVSLVGSQGRAWVVDSIWWSQEAAAVRAGDYYQTFLGRGPDPSGQAAWAQVLLAHGEGAVRTGIAGSLEYRSRAIARYP